MVVVVRDGIPVVCVCVVVVEGGRGVSCVHSMTKTNPP